jgi:hypothetical protein
VKSVSARSVSAKAHTPVNTTNKSESHLREYARPSARPNIRTGHHAMIEDSNTKSANTMKTPVHPGNSSSGAIKDFSKGDSRCAMYVSASRPASPDDTNTAAGMSNHGAMARVALPR